MKVALFLSDESFIAMVARIGTLTSVPFFMHINIFAMSGTVLR